MIFGEKCPIQNEKFKKLIDALGEVEGEVIPNADKITSAEICLSYVFGYCPGNDFSARDLQRKTSQFLLGKTCDGFAPIGLDLSGYPVLGNWVTTEPSLIKEVDGGDVFRVNSGGLPAIDPVTGMLRVAPFRLATIKLTGAQLVQALETTLVASTGHVAGHLRHEGRTQGRIPRFFGPNRLGSRR